WASHKSARVRAVTAGALQAGSPERALIEALAEDPAREVREAVLNGIRYSPDLEEWRIDSALRAAREENLGGVQLVLSVLEMGAERAGTRLELSTSHVQRMCEIVLASAREARLHNEYELSSIFAHLK